MIDVFYKLKALHAEGVKIYLHCYNYGRGEAKELEQFCEKVYYYERLTGIASALSIKPYIVASRSSEELINNLLKNNYPILFEGLHTCYFLSDKRLKNRLKIVRAANIEHHYYLNLFKIEKNIFKKIYFLIEAIKLKHFQARLKNADNILAISNTDADYLFQNFPNKNVQFVSGFHQNNEIKSLTGKGKYVLYHGNLSVGENIHVAEFLINEVFVDLQMPLIIAGLNPPENLYKLIKDKPHISIIAGPDDKQMNDLVQNAQVNMLLTFQATGLKLKLLNTLYNGRFCLVNDKMLAGTSLDELCVITNKKPTEIQKELKTLMNKDFEYDEVEKRKSVLQKLYDNKTNAKKLVELL